MEKDKITIFIGTVAVTFKIGKTPMFQATPQGVAQLTPETGTVKRITVYKALHEIIIEFKDSTQICYHNACWTEGITY